jgi:hypothetical protein
VASVDNVDNYYDPLKIGHKKIHIFEGDKPGQKCG